MMIYSFVCLSNHSHIKKSAYAIDFNTEVEKCQVVRHSKTSLFSSTCRFDLRSTKQWYRFRWWIEHFSSKNYIYVYKIFMNYINLIEYIKKNDACTNLVYY